MMTLRVILPDRCLFEGKVAKVVADGVDGSRGFLPRHIDCVMALKPGVMTCTDAEGETTFFAVQGGLLVKKGPQITVTTRAAAMADRLDDLPELVLELFEVADEHAEAADRAANRLETMLLREFMELNR